MNFIKNIYNIIFIVLLILYILLVVFAFNNLNKFISTATNPQNNVTIVLDAGHGGEDGGAVANNIIEKDINLSITKELAKIFKATGFNVVMTRNSDNMINTEGDSIASKKVSDMKNRLEIFNESDNNVVISIHQNKFPQEQYYGAQVFYSCNDESSSLLAESIRDTICDFIQPENNRQCKETTKDIYLLYNSKVPSVIVECGFISNVNEANLLKNKEYQRKIAYSIFIGYLNYMNK